MRVTSKGQVTIPQHIRERHGLLPNTEIEFVEDAGGVRIVQAQQLSTSQRQRGQAVADDMVKRLQGLKSDTPLTTDELMRMTRGDEWPDLH
ncbi:MAG: AbrB/MazE/SpoVT family DNA-binding domain-containing protein [Beijerinckiaceae bacterium]